MTNLINTNKDIFIDETTRNKKYVVPNLRPLILLRLCLESHHLKNMVVLHITSFLKIIKGFNFRVLDSLYKEPFQGEFVASEPSEDRW